MRVENTALRILHSFENFKKIWQLERVWRSVRKVLPMKESILRNLTLTKHEWQNLKAWGFQELKPLLQGCIFRSKVDLNSACSGCSFSCLLDLFSFLWRKRKKKANQNPFIKLWTKTHSLLEQLWGFWRSPGPEVVKHTAAKTGINAENCYTLSWTGSWSRWSLWFDNTQRLSQLILSERKQRDNSITTRNWASLGENPRYCVVCQSWWEASELPVPVQHKPGSLDLAHRARVFNCAGDQLLGAKNKGCWWVCPFLALRDQQWVFLGEEMF